MPTQRNTTHSTVWFLAPTLLVTLAMVTVVFDHRLASPATDLHSYIANAHRADWFPRSYFQNPVQFLSNEVHFHLWLSWLSRLLGGAEPALRVLTAVATFGVLLLLSRGAAVRRVLVLLLLVHPRVLDLLTSQTRFALATMFFLIAIELRSPIFRYSVALIAVSFHFYFAIMFVLLVVSDLANRVSSLQPTLEARRLTSLLTAVVVASFGATAVWASGDLLGLIGDRRYGGGATSVGDMYFVASVGLLIGYLVWNARRVNRFPLLALLFVAASFTAAHLVDTFSSRYLAFAMVLAAYTMPTRFTDLGFVLLPPYLVFLGVSYYYWLLP